ASVSSPMRSSSTAMTSRAVAICSGPMRKLAVSPVPTTKVPTPCRVCTMPPACSLDSASRTTVRLTPNSPMISASVGSLSPERLLLTGAAGGLGRVLRPRLKAYCKTLRLSDHAALGSAAAGEELVVARLEDRPAIDALLEGVDAVVHLGGVSVEGPFDPIAQANIIGVYNLYEAARRHGVKRVVFASSNHVTGFYRQDQVISPRDPMRPDGLYGISKAFGENLSRYYFDRYGIETACLRIGSSFPEPRDRRMLSTWLSYDDLERLVLACLT